LRVLRHETLELRSRQLLAELDRTVAAPCSWNTFFAKSTPMLISFMDALSFLL